MKDQRMEKGILIAVEGIDGSGKSTLAKALTKALADGSHEVVLTREPGGSKLGQCLRKQLHERDEKIDDKAEFLLFAADRAQHFSSVIIPALKRNAIVISDRLSDSSIVYQGYGRGLDIDMIKKINHWAMQGLKPDITLYVEIDYMTAAARLEARQEKLTSFEKERAIFFERVIAGYNEIYHRRDDVIILDGSLPAGEVAKQAVILVKRKIDELYR